MANRMVRIWRIGNWRLAIHASASLIAALPASAFCLLPSTFISVAHGLQQVGMIGRHAAEGVAGADLGDRAFVAVHAAVVPHLQEERAVAEAVAALDTLGAADAELLVNRVFVIGVLDVGALDGRRRAEAVLRAGVQVVGLRLESSRCKAGSSRRWRRRGRTSRRTARARSGWRSCRSARISAGQSARPCPWPCCARPSRPATRPSRQRRRPRPVAQKLAPGDRRIAGDGIHGQAVDTRRNPKPEGRNPKEVRSPKSEVGNPMGMRGNWRLRFPKNGAVLGSSRNPFASESGSDFGLRASFGLRGSGFGFHHHALRFITRTSFATRSRM